MEEKATAGNAPGDPDLDELEKLGSELALLGFDSDMLIVEGWRPSLVARNPRAPQMAETILAGAAWYWWPWGERISPFTDRRAAAAIIARVLRCDGPGARDGHHGI